MSFFHQCISWHGEETLIKRLLETFYALGWCLGFGFRRLLNKIRVALPVQPIKAYLMKGTLEKGLHRSKESEALLAKANHQKVRAAGKEKSLTKSGLDKKVFP